VIDQQAIPAEPGAATRRFLRACDERAARPVDWSLAPSRYKRYPGAVRIDAAGAGWPGELLRGLLGLTRITWCQPHDEAGQPAPGRSRLVIGRPAPSGGALYPIEAYCATAGALCHYDVVHHRLEVVRDGDHRHRLTDMLTRPDGDLPPDLVLALTAAFWRNGFKYEDFAYRLQCQETGVLAAQAMTLAGLLGLDIAVHIGFDGDAADRLLGLDPAAEGCLAILTFSRVRPGGPGVHGQASEDRVSEDRQAPPGRPALPAEPPPPVTASLPHLAALHAATRRPPAVPCSAGRAGEPAPVPPPPPAGAVIELPSAAPVTAGDGIARRASPLNGYRPEPVPVTDLGRILAACTAGYPGDLPGTASGPQATALCVLALNVAGLPAGVFRYLPGRHALAEIGRQDAITTVTSGPLGLNTQAALRTCAAVVIPAGDPLAGTWRFGDLWYRLQQAETGLVVHRATLAAAAVGLTSRIHSDGTNPATDAALGLAGTPWRSLSFLLLGTPRTSGPARTALAWPEQATRPPAANRGKPQTPKEYTCPSSPPS
jgi:SagB-type dehydrogenase family enzyme